MERGKGEGGDARDDDVDEPVVVRPDDGVDGELDEDPEDGVVVVITSAHQGDDEMQRRTRRSIPSYHAG